MKQEAVERTILDFHPVEPVRIGERLFLGQVGPGINIFYGDVTYPRRFTGSNDEPFIIGRLTTQPVVALELEGKIDCATGKFPIIPLAYVSNIRGLPHGLPEKIAAHLENWQSLRRQITGEWEV